MTMLGLKHSEGTKMKMHLAQQKRDPSTRARGISPFKGKKHSEQTRDKMRLSYIKRMGGIPKDKRYRHDGYVQVRCPGHPCAERWGWFLEHRLVMEKMLGRYLNDNELVHHIDGNRENNDISNLQLVTAGEHKRTYRDGFKEGLGRGFAAGFLYAHMRRNK